jgi:hypothetical protein
MKGTYAIVDVIEWWTTIVYSLVGGGSIIVLVQT